MLAQQEIMFPKLFSSLLSALHPLMSFGGVGLESKIVGTRFAWKKHPTGPRSANDVFHFNLDDEDDADDGGQHGGGIKFQMSPPK
jgi:hypothetical protein